ncbi:hypothetical protein ACNRWW_19700 [Metabacillus sp. HB246100]
MVIKLPDYQAQISSSEIGMGVFDAIIKGVEQASREMQQQRQAQHMQQGKRKTKSKQRSYGLER